jgi:hypothetical protein
MAKSAPFYPVHKIETGKYTNGTEFVTDDVNQFDYIGLYHILPNGDYWSESKPTADSIKLIEKKFAVSPDVKNYNLIQNRKPENYISPIPFYPILNFNDYENGYIMRYFVQKRNNPYATITEIDSTQYITLNTKNRPGISMLLWNHTSIRWSIKGGYSMQLNMQEISKAENAGFKNLSNYLKNTLEFWK